jgi:signal transduction histidine kinase/CheY-like chemotaxis protein
MPRPFGTGGVLGHPIGAERLLSVVQRLSFAKSLDEVTAVIRTAARQLTGADGATFVLREGDRCHYADEDAIGPLWKGLRFPLDECISGWVMKHGVPAAIADVFEDSRIPQETYRPTFVKSLLMVPVHPPDARAAIGLYWATTHEATPDELAIGTALADTAALALANVQLYEDLKQSVAREMNARLAAEESARLKDQFLATLSHELRTPLNVILGWAWQLRRADLPPQLSRAVEVIERNATVQARLVEDLLDTSRANAGDMKLHLALVDLFGVCELVADLTRPSAIAKGLDFTVRLDGTAPIICGDGNRVQRIVENLVSNALKFTPAGGAISITVTRTGSRARLVVTDTGIGIHPEFLPHMFESFRQADVGTTRRTGGLGLGLTIVRQLVEMHGGVVHAESPGEGQGTSVTVEFPIPAVFEQTEKWMHRHGGSAPGTRLDNITILVVDDEPDVCEAVAVILEQHGATVRTATTATEALALIAADAPDVLLADLSMPEIDGFTLMQQVRALAGPIPAAALTAYRDADHRGRAKEAGYRLFLEKPIPVDELTKKLAELASQGPIAAA